jgi:hypothetical protein
MGGNEYLAFIFLIYKKRMRLQLLTKGSFCSQFFVPSRAFLQFSFLKGWLCLHLEHKPNRCFWNAARVSELVHELMQSKLPSLTIHVRESLRLFDYR